MLDLQAKLCWQNCLLGETGSKPCCQETYRIPEQLWSLLSDQALTFEKKPASLQHSEGYSEVIAQGQQLSPLILQIVHEPRVLSILLSEHVLQGSDGKCHGSKEGSGAQARAFRETEGK